MEYTGVYIYGLLEYLKDKGYIIWVEMPLRIKRSVGLERAGDDKLSSQLIAQYAYRNQDDYNPRIAENDAEFNLRQLIAQRESILQSIKALEVPVKELKA